MEPITVIMMVLILGFYWGGFLYLANKAAKSKNNN